MRQDAGKAVGLVSRVQARRDESRWLSRASPQTARQASGRKLLRLLDSSLGARPRVADTFPAVNEPKQSLPVAAAPRHAALRNAAVLTTAPPGRVSPSETCSTLLPHPTPV